MLNGLSKEATMMVNMMIVYSKLFNELLRLAGSYNFWYLTYTLWVCWTEDFYRQPRLLGFDYSGIKTSDPTTQSTKLVSHLIKSCNVWKKVCCGEIMETASVGVGPLDFWKIVFTWSIFRFFLFFIIRIEVDNDFEAKLICKLLESYIRCNWIRSPMEIAENAWVIVDSRKVGIQRKSHAFEQIPSVDRAWILDSRLTFETANVRGICGSHQKPRIQVNKNPFFHAGFIFQEFLWKSEYYDTWK